MMVVTRRIRLAIGTLTPNTRRAIDTAVRLAGASGATIDCVFVEEDDLLRAAALPITREVGVVSATSPNLPRQLAGALVRHAALARQALSRAALPARIGWSFEVGRGHLHERALEHAGDQDLVVIGVPCLALEPSLGTPTRARDALLALIDERLAELQTDLDGPANRLAWLPRDDTPLADMVERLRPQVLAVTREALASAPPALWRTLRRLGVTVVLAPDVRDD